MKIGSITPLTRLRAVLSRPAADAAGDAPPAPAVLAKPVKPPPAPRRRKQPEDGKGWLLDEKV